jgi:hypothetical protein
MQGMITLERPGRIRGVTWTTNALAQIYYDKTLHVGCVQWDASGLLASPERCTLHFKADSITA